MNARYGKERVLRGLLHFVSGKVLSAICGFLAMILVVRLLTVQDFADYSVLVALIELATAISGLGISHALLRYVPELYTKQYVVAFRHIIISAVSLRLSSLLLVVVFAWTIAPSGAPLIGMADAVDTARLFLLIVFIRATSHFLSQILESTLHQGITQIGFSLAAVARLAGMMYLANGDGATLIDVIWVEIVSDLLCLLVMLFGVVRVAWGRISHHPPDDDRFWVKRNGRKIVRFAISGYLQHLAILPFGANTNRVVGSTLFSDVTMANFGFAHSLYEYVKRYLPAQLLVGLVRPVVLARFSDQRDFSRAAGTCEGIALINTALIGGMMSLLIVGGTEALGWLSSGKYGSETAILLGALLLVVFLETRRLMLEMLIQAVERYELLIPSNLFLSASIIPAVIVFPLAGAVGFPLINGVALALSNLWVQRTLAGFGYRYPTRWVPTLKLLALCVITTVMGHGLVAFGLHWSIALALMLVAYSLATWRLCNRDFRSFFTDLIDNRKQDAGMIV